MMILKNVEKGISLIALIITIIVIIILAAIVIGVAMSTPESANKAKYLGDLSEIQQAVAIKRAENLMPTINNIEADMNDGFTKITMKKYGETEAVDGWVVNLDNIEVKNSTLGNGYSEVQEGDEIIIGPGAPDIYVYDSEGVVYYAKGQKISGTTIYSAADINNPVQIDFSNPDYWVFDEISGTITQYIGPDVEEVIVPDYIDEIKVNEIKESTSAISAFASKVNTRTVTVSNGITTIGRCAFYSCKEITKVNLPSSITIINEFAFCDSGLTSITLPNSLATIRTSAFELCNGITSVTIPESVSSIETSVFAGCENLTTINVDINNLTYKSIDGVLFSKAGTDLIMYPCGNTRELYSIPNTVTNIYSWAFEGCKGIKEIIIPSGVTGIPIRAFSDCINLSNVEMPDSIEYIGNYAFSNCKALKEITLSENLTAIAIRAFEWCTGLLEINIPASVTSIDSFAFYFCTELTSITVNKSNDGSLTGAPWGSIYATVTWNP